MGNRVRSGSPCVTHDEGPRFATLLVTLSLVLFGCTRQSTAEPSGEDDSTLYFDKTAPGQGIIFLLVSFGRNQVDAVQGSPSNDGSIAAERHTPLLPADRQAIEAFFVAERLPAYQSDNTAGQEPSTNAAVPAQNGRCPDGSACVEPCLCLPPPGPDPASVKWVVDYKPERLFYVFDDSNSDDTSNLVQGLEAMHGRYLNP